jgi:universal stress protein A
MTATTDAPSATPAPVRPNVVNLRKILVPLDFSAHSRKALNYAVKLAGQFGSEVTIINIVAPVIYAEGMVLPAAMENLDRVSEEHAQAELDKIAEEVRSHNVKCDTHVLLGHPSDEIVNYAKKHETDLLLITTHGRTGLQHFLLGSTAERILRHAPCPVMVVRDQEHEFV